MNLSTQLRMLGACPPAVEWAKNFDTPQAAWDACERGGWMLWILGRLDKSKPWSDGRKPLVACVIECALTARHLWPKSQAKRIGGAVGVILGWTRGEVNDSVARDARQELRDAADAADAAADAAYAAAAAAAAYAAAAAADAAAAAYAAAAAAYAAYAAAAADAAYAAAAARLQSQKETAAIVRQHFPHPPEVK